MSEKRLFCTFHLDDMLLGIGVQDVQEVIRYQRLTPVPMASSVVAGLINLRGQIVTAIDLRERLQLGPRDSDPPPMNIVVRNGDEALSFLVDEVGEVIEVDDTEFEPPPETVSGVARELIMGAYKLEGRLLLILDMPRAAAVTA